MEITSEQDVSNDNEFVLYIPLRVSKDLIAKNQYLETLQLTAEENDDAATTIEQQPAMKRLCKRVNYPKILELETFAQMFGNVGKDIELQRIPALYKLCLEWSQPDMCVEIEKQLQIRAQDGPSRMSMDLHILFIIALHSVALLNPIRRKEFISFINAWPQVAQFKAILLLKANKQSYLDLQRIVYDELTIPTKPIQKIIPKYLNDADWRWEAFFDFCKFKGHLDYEDVITRWNRSSISMPKPIQSLSVDNILIDSLLVPITITNFKPRLQSKMYNIIDLDTFPWDVAVIFGGILESCAREEDEEEECTDAAGIPDVDILIRPQLNGGPEEWEKHCKEGVLKVIKYLQRRIDLLELKAYVTEQGHSVVISCEGISRHFQISGVSCTENISITKHLIDFDFAHNQAIYDGQQILALPYTQRSWLHKELYSRQKFDSIEIPRLYKALLKGYTLSEEFSDLLNTFQQWKAEKGYLLQHKDYFPRAEVQVPINQMRLMQILHGQQCFILNDSTIESKIKQMSIVDYHKYQTTTGNAASIANDNFWKCNIIQ
jgi:hypothetical protein